MMDAVTGISFFVHGKRIFRNEFCDARCKIMSFKQLTPKMPSRQHFAQETHCRID
jgi:hypothetical protein